MKTDLGSVDAPGGHVCNWSRIRNGKSASDTRGVGGAILAAVGRESGAARSALPPVQLAVQECCTIPIGCLMPSETTYTSLRQNLASVLDQVVDQQETVIVRRRGARDVALLPATELAGLMETAHLLRSPRNARRLQSALRRAEQRRTKPGTAAGLRREMLGEARS